MREVIKRDRVQVGEAHRSRTNGQGAGSRTPAVPGVRLVQVDGQVQAIELTCRCGAVSIVEVELEDAAEESRETRS